MTKAYGALAGFACVVLAIAAVGLGGLNQDEGWYLYAARLVREGQLPYRDFFFTQGPVLPVVYGALYRLWAPGGLLAARVLTLLLGLTGLALAAGTVRLLVPADRRNLATIVFTLLLGCNLYHLYYLAIPKTYALASLCVQAGFFLLARALVRPELRHRALHLAAAGAALGFAAGTRVSLGVLPAVAGLALLLAHRRLGFAWLWFGLGGLLALTLAYGPFLVDPAARSGLAAAQAYHAARGGFSPVFTIGSLSRLIRWYLPLFILAGLAAGLLRRSAEEPADEPARNVRFVLTTLFAAFLAVALVQFCAPFPYEDYQVPVMGLLAIVATALLVGRLAEDRLPQLALLTLGLAYATAFGSPLLEKWTMNGQDRFWTRVKAQTELGQLRAAAAEIERLDPGGTTLFTQDLYLAVETGRRVPKGLEMGPFSELSDDAWQNLLTTTDCPVAALSGYTFAIEPPACTARDPEQVAAWRALLTERYGSPVAVFEDFGQQATRLELMCRTKEEAQ